MSHTQAERFLVQDPGGTGEFVIQDTVTELHWRRAHEAGQTWDEALAFCEALEFGGHDDWRLPSTDELASLVDYSGASPAIDATAFPGTPASWFWSSNRAADGSGNTWGVRFDRGSVVNVLGTVGYTRCIREEL